MSTMTQQPEPANPRPPNLTARHTDQTRQWILVAATDLLELQGLAQLSNAAVALRAGISERTVYRHFSTREALLDEVAVTVAARLDSPEAPHTAPELLAYPAQLFASFEARPALTRAALASEVFSRMRDGPAAKRWQAVQRILDEHQPPLGADDRLIAAANIRYLLTATTWNYYRQQLGLSAEQTVNCVRQALAAQLYSLGLLAEYPPAVKP